jgi:hypothetical protein
VALQHPNLLGLGYTLDSSIHPYTDTDIPVLTEIQLKNTKVSGLTKINHAFLFAKGEVWWVQHFFGGKGRENIPHPRYQLIQRAHRLLIIL